MKAENRLAFLTASAWIDVDGRHVWLSHDCADGRSTSMLPTTWKANESGRVEPSIDCRDCGAHFFAQIEAKPDPTLGVTREAGK